MARLSRHVEPRAWQEYLESVAQCHLQLEGERKLQALVRSWAELQYRMRGGSKCSACRACVRHVLPIIVERHDGSHHEFECLCTRCLIGEQALSRIVYVKAGSALLRYDSARQPIDRRALALAG